MSTKLDIKTTGAMTARDAGAGRLKAYFEANKDALKDSLPNHIDTDRMLRVALGAYRMTPRLAEVEIKSAFSAILTCAQLGLEPNSPLGQCSLVPFKNGRQMDCQLIIQYRGFITLAARSGVFIESHIVYEGDDFDLVYGLHADLTHRPKGIEDIERALGVYAVATHKDGRKQFEFLWAHSVKKTRDMVLDKMRENWKRDQSPWRTHPEAMWRKTAVRRLANYLQLSPDEQKAYSADGATGAEMSEALEGKFEVVPSIRDDIVGDVEQDEPEQQSKHKPAPESSETEERIPETESKTERKVSLSTEILTCKSNECLDEIADRLRTMVEAKQVTVGQHRKATRQIATQREKLAQQS